MLEETILIVTDDVEGFSVGGEGSLRDTVQQRLTRVVEVPASVLEQNMNRLLQVAK